MNKNEKFIEDAGFSITESEEWNLIDEKGETIACMDLFYSLEEAEKEFVKIIKKIKK